MAVDSIDSLDILMGQPQTTEWSDNWMTGHVALIFGIQFDAPSIGMLIYVYISSYMTQCSYSHSFISSLALSPRLGAKLCCILDLSMQLG